MKKFLIYVLGFTPCLLYLQYMEYVNQLKSSSYYMKVAIFIIGYLLLEYQIIRDYFKKKGDQ